MNSRGFTLLELIIAMSIAVILLAVGALSLGNLRAGQTPETEARALVATLQSAQERSIGQEEGARWGVYFDIAATPATYYLYKVDEVLKLSDPFTGRPAAASDTHALKTPLQLVLVTPSVTSSLIFNKSTGKPSAVATIKITDGHENTARLVTISAQGIIDYE